MTHWQVYSSFFTFVGKGCILNLNFHSNRGCSTYFNWEIETGWVQAENCDLFRHKQGNSSPVFTVYSLFDKFWPLPCAKQTRPHLNWCAFRRWNALVALLKYSGGLELNLFFNFNHKQVGFTLPKVSSALPKRLCDEVQRIWWELGRAAQSCHCWTVSGLFPNPCIVGFFISIYNCFSGNQSWVMMCIT